MLYRSPVAQFSDGRLAFKYREFRFIIPSWIHFAIHEGKGASVPTTTLRTILRRTVLLDVALRLQHLIHTIFDERLPMSCDHVYITQSKWHR